MSDTLAPRDSSLAQVLMHRARGASDRRLALDTAAGLLVAMAAAWWRPRGWLLLLALALGFLAFGAWGIADRELSDPAMHDRRAKLLLRGLEIVALTLGVAAGLLLALQLVGVILGTWIS